MFTEPLNPLQAQMILAKHISTFCIILLFSIPLYIGSVYKMHKGFLALIRFLSGLIIINERDGIVQSSFYAVDFSWQLIFYL